MDGYIRASSLACLLARSLARLLACLLACCLACLPCLLACFLACSLRGLRIDFWKKIPGKSGKKTGKIRSPGGRPRHLQVFPQFLVETTFRAAVHLKESRSSRDSTTCLRSARPPTGGTLVEPPPARRWPSQRVRGFSTPQRLALPIWPGLQHPQLAGEEAGEEEEKARRRSCSGTFI